MLSLFAGTIDGQKTDNTNADPNDSELVVYKLSKAEVASFSTKDNIVSSFWEQHWVGHDYIKIIAPKDTFPGHFVFQDPSRDASLVVKAGATSEGRSECISKRPVAYEQVVLGSGFPDVEDRRARPEKRAHVVDRPQLRARDPERDHRRRVAVHDCHDLGPRAVDLAVDVALDEALALVPRQRLAVGAAFHDIRGGDERRRERARDEEMLRPVVAAGADVPVGVEHLVHGEDPARGDEIADKRAAGGNAGRLSFHVES